MKIKMTVNGQTSTVTMENSEVAQDFVSLLPLTLKLDDYNNKEKISYLPRKLTKEGAPAGVSAKVGDLAYYAPWGNLAIFYKDHGYAPGLVKLGTFDGGIEILKSDVPLNATFESIKP